ncbi:ABC transporter substrate-binding protein [Cohnella sp. GCM10020058]|uniref:ABC transporter substrate-binding protein n=1 Tax=Cohnella sp. GCM10020058 TaxID=3317330 RepID=UPI003642597C
MKKSKIVSLALAMTLTGLLAGCGGSKDNAPGGSASASAPSSSGQATGQASGSPEQPTVTGKLTFLTWETNIVDTKLKDMADRFMADYPGVELKIEGFTDNQTIKIRAASNSLPDIVNVTDTHLSRDQWSKFFVPLNDLPIADKLIGMDSLVAPDGKNYTVPRGLMLTPVVWYNKDIFAELGLEVPKTYSAFLEVSHKIKDSGKYIPLSSGAKDAWPLDPYQQLAPIIGNDTNIYNAFAEQEEPFTADSGYVKSFGILKDLVDKGYFEKDPLSVGFDAATNDFVSGKSAMMLMGTWLYQNLSEKGVDMTHFAIFPFPVSETPADTTMLTASPDLPMAINKNTKSMDAALAFLDWYYSKYDSEFMTYSGMLSPLKDADNSSIPWAGFVKDYRLNIVTLAPQQEKAIKVWNNSGITLYKSLQELVAGRTVDQVVKDLNGKFKKAVASAK